MANIKLTRVDFRLIHGQIITKWRGVFGINKIVVIDDILAADDFMIRVYSSAVPVGTKVKVYSEEKALRLWNKNQFGENAEVLVLFKDIETCDRVIRAGVGLREVQLGGVPQTAERRLIRKAVFLGAKEMGLVCGLHDELGVSFSVQVVPEDSKMGYDEILKIYQN
ncbi:PTS sugar transporter subunit IIB [Oscillospiraceae bacterium 44-34]